MRSPKPRSSMRSLGRSTNASVIWIARAATTIQIDWIGSRSSWRKLPCVTSTSTIATPPAIAMEITPRHRTTGGPAAGSLRLARRRRLCRPSPQSRSLRRRQRRAVADVRYEVLGSVARVTIDRPERRNAMSFDVMEGLRDAVARAKADDAVRVLVLTGAGDKAFCAGADLGGGGIADGASAAHDGRGMLADLFRDMWDLGKPTIARVRGYALAGGFGLALACDFVVAADDAQFGTPEVNVGLWPYMITVPL